MSGTNPIRTAGQAVPFVGWSRAAAEFRRLAAAHAPPGEASVLLLGPPGVGKRTMASVWQSLCERVRLPLVDLDAPPNKAVKFHEPCIAVSRRPLPDGAPYFDLGTGRESAFTAGPEEGDTIGRRLAARFDLRLYVPPLRERPVDVLCLLHHFNQFVLRPGGYYYERVSAEVLAALIGAEWPGNARGLRDYLLKAAERDAGPGPRPEGDGAVNLGTLRAMPARRPGGRGEVPGAASREGWNPRGRGGHAAPGWTLLDLLPALGYKDPDPCFPFAELPALAIRVYQERATACVGQDPRPPGRPAYPPEAFRGLAVGQFVREGILGSTARLTAAEIEARRKAIDWTIFKGMSFDGYGVSLLCRIHDAQCWAPSDSDVAAKVEVLNAHPLEGTTFWALRDGLAVDPGRAASVLAPKPVKPTPTEKKGKPKTPPLKPWTAREREVEKMVFERELTTAEVASELVSRREPGRKGVSRQYAHKIIKVVRAKRKQTEKVSRSVNATRTLPIDPRGQVTTKDRRQNRDGDD